MERSQSLPNRLWEPVSGFLVSGRLPPNSWIGGCAANSGSYECPLGFVIVRWTWGKSAGLPNWLTPFGSRTGRPRASSGAATLMWTLGGQQLPGSETFNCKANYRIYIPISSCGIFIGGRNLTRFSLADLVYLFLNVSCSSLTDIPAAAIGVAI